MERILVIEDDKNISKLIKYNLEKANYEPRSVTTAEGGWDILDKEHIDLIILDIMLPKMDGLEFCKLLKQNKKLAGIPVIMLTAKGEEVDRVVGFELGADDYMIKPFSPRELILRIKAILKRRKPVEDSTDILIRGKIKIDMSRHKVYVDNKETGLTQLEFKLLHLLMQRKGRVQTRDVLLNDVWDMSAEVTTRTIDTHIKKLRQKLSKSGNSIETVRGIGYRFKEQ